MKAFVFPGQGSQFVVMGKDIYDNNSLAKELFDKINNASASSHPLSSLNLTGEFLGKDYVYRNATTF